MKRLRTPETGGRRQKSSNGSAATSSWNNAEPWRSGLPACIATQTRFAQAYHHANLANTLAAEATIDGDLSRVEADIALSGVAMASGNFGNSPTRSLSIASTAYVRGSTEVWCPRSQRAGAGAASQSELLADNGGVDQALKLASEACSIVDRNATDPSTEISSHAMLAVMKSAPRQRHLPR